MTLDLFVDPQLLRLAVAMSIPFILAALGELIMERAGLLNVGIEGIMAVGAAVGFLGTWALGGQYVAGMLAAMAAGALLSLVLGYFGVTLRAEQISVGLALLVFGLGLASLLYRAVIGIQFVAPRVDVLAPVWLPGLSQAPVIGEILFTHNPLVYLTFLLVPLVHFVLFGTSAGLRLRACGENPRAADTLGVHVARVRYIAAACGGLLIGLAGAYLPLAITGAYSDGMAAGRGWIALMLVILSRWLPWRIVAGAFLFAYLGALQFRLALVTQIVPPQLLLSLPYLLAIVVLIRVYRGAQAPAALAVPYDREARG